MGRRAPARLRAFILTVVIADDVGVLVVIAFVYTGELSYGALAVAAVLYGVVLVLLRLNVLSRPPLILLAIATWVATAESGVHPTIAGVLLGLAVSGVPPERQDLDAGAFAASTVRGSAAREPAASLAARSSLAPHAVTTRGLM